MKKNYLIQKYSDEEQLELASVLKNKRIELGKNLDEVAEGICSTSYLSRIENNLVRFQEPYLKLLFEKLDINYETLKENRKNNLFVEVLKKILLGNEKDYKTKIEQIMASNCFLGTERDLILLYDNLLNNNFEETGYVIDKLQENCAHFSNSEMTFFMYLVALYYFKTNQINLSYHQVKILANVKIDDEIMKWVIKELSMDIYYLVGKKIDYIVLYNEFVKTAPLPYFKDLMMKQKTKMITLQAESNFHPALDQMHEFKQNISSVNQEIRNVFYYQLATMYLQHGDYEKILDLLTTIELTTPLVKILSFALLNFEGKSENKRKAIDLLNKYNFTKYDDLIKNICYYVTTKLENTNENYPRLLNFLKNNVFHLLNHSYDQIIYYYVLKEIFVLNTKCSKYKDSCNLINKVFDNLENKILNN